MIAYEKFETFKLSHPEKLHLSQYNVDTQKLLSLSLFQVSPSVAYFLFWEKLLIDVPLPRPLMHISLH